MSATRNLEGDHVYILRLIDVMEHITRQPELLVEPVEEVTDLIRNFADGLHHAKEEKLLFPLMVSRGFSTTQGPIAVMLSDHEQGRAFVRQISEGISRYRQGDKSARATVDQGMKGYIELLRNHIGKENNVLFRMADNVLNPDEQDQLLSQFTVIDQGKGDQTSDKYITRIFKLVRELKVP